MIVRKYIERSVRNGEYLTGYFLFSFFVLGGFGRFILVCFYRSYLYVGV